MVVAAATTMTKTEEADQKHRQAMDESLVKGHGFNFQIVECQHFLSFGLDCGLTQ